MFKKRIAEIEARKAEISTEIQEADEARTLELDQEVDSLNAELVSLRSKMSVADKLGDPVPTEGEQRTGSPVNREMRAKQLRETRSVTITSGKLATPTKTGGINDPHPEVSSVVDQVTVEPCEGMGGYKVAYLKNSGEGADATEGEDRSETDPEFDYAAPYSEGLAIVGKHKKGDGVMEYSIIDTKGELVAELKYDDFNPDEMFSTPAFSDGILVFGNKAVGKDGKILFRSPSDWIITDFNDGYANFNEDGKWGLIDSKGEV